MSGKRFTLDTNILVYSVDLSAGAKYGLARSIRDRAADRDCLLTLQSVSEFVAAVTRKRLIARPEAAEIAEKLLIVFPSVGVSVTAVRAALAFSVAGRASYWDALLIATAAEAGCTAILTEDCANGSDLLGIEIVNPFDDGKLSPRAQQLLEQ